MAVFEFARFRLSLCFSFFAMLSVFLTLDTTGFGLFGIAACLVHEFGHLAAVAATRAGISGVELYGGGIRIHNIRQNTAVTLSGCAANFAVFAVLAGGSLTMLTFAVINLFVGCFNLLPVGCLDGRVFLESLLTRRFAPRCSEVILRRVEIFCVVVVALVLLALLLCGNVGITAVFVALYLVFQY
ncbi:hypothetical protein FACS1894133_5540 [Clostridia bacterium]|nr:hypothetical protein FACS1894133_5540 [Clostridia bacterium]